MKHFILFILIVLSCIPVFAKHPYKEKEYQFKWCAAENGVTEYELDDLTRVDCLTDKYAVEFDFAYKWAECIGQAIYYGKKTNKRPACALILENPEKDQKYVKRLNYATKKIRRFKIFLIDINYMQKSI